LLSIWKSIDVLKITVGEQIYPDVIIEFCLLIKTIYHLPLRQTTGFVEDLLALQGCENYCVPDYSTLCRRSTQEIVANLCNAVVKIATKAVPVPPYLAQRNQAVERIKEVGSKDWKKEIGYHGRSLAETAMFRYKIIFGDKARSRIAETQRTEVNIKCKILNKFTSIGMPKTIKILKTWALLQG